jgi:hypothetical protein
LHRRVLSFIPPIALLLALAMATAAQAAPGIRWHRAVRIEPASNGGVQAVSCPSTRLCVAVDASGHELFSTRPTGGKGSWSRAGRIDGGNSLTGISCPTTRLCVAVDENGVVLTTTRPTKGARSWKRQGRVDTALGLDGGWAGLLGISCPTTSLCVAVDGSQSGRVFSTTRPLGGSRAWRSTQVGGTLTSVSCRTAGLCVVAGSKHAFSTNPASGSWRSTGSLGGGAVISAIDCPALSLCVGVGYGNSSPGLVTTSTSPRTRNWQTVMVEPSPPLQSEGVLDAVGCPNRGLCVALDTADNAFVSSTPASGGWNGPRAIRRNSASQQNAIACTRTFCVVVDSAGVESTGIVRS